MRVLVTGASGMLGRQVVAEGLRRGHAVFGYGSRELNITDRAAVHRTIRACNPEIVIHCAAYTNVEKAESEPDDCRLVNVEGTRNVALACRETGIPMLYISTDYVFDGSGDEPRETSDECNPINVYGLTKYQGECCVRDILDASYIVRVSWLFGPGGANFVNKVLQRAASGSDLSIVGDQVGSPTYTLDLASLLMDMAPSGKFGVYHGTNEGFCSWYQFAAEILRLAGHEFTSLTSIESESLNHAAKRPKNSRMSKRSLDDAGFARLRPWQDAVADYIMRNQLGAARE